MPPLGQAAPRQQAGMAEGAVEAGGGPGWGVGLRHPG